MNRTAIYHIATILLFVCCVCSGMTQAAPSFAASAPSGRILHVSSSGVYESGETQFKAARSISAALKIARAGDTIRVAPGVYTETLRVSVPDLRIEGSYSSENIPKVTVAAPTGAAGAPLLDDRRNTVWVGIAFEGGQGLLAELRGFTGRFEHCRFDLGREPSIIAIHGGSPRFISCAFLGNAHSVSTLELYGQGGGRSQAEFVYCLFQDFGAGALFFKGDQDASFTNCLLANCNYALLRKDGNQAEVAFVNTAFYLMAAPCLVRQQADAPKVSLSNCLYAPAPNEYFRWKARRLEEQSELILEQCMTASPRFKGGRKVLLNLGIDDSRNLPVWDALCEHAGKFGLPVTFAIDTMNMKEENWPTVIKRLEQGHEIGAHTVTHSSLLSKFALRLGYAAEQAASAEASVDSGKKLTVTVDGKEYFSINLGGEGGYPSMEDLVRRLNEAGLRAELGDATFRHIPAYLLAGTERQDIRFMSYLPALVLDTNAYMIYSLSKSKEDIETALNKYGAREKQCAAVICPFSEVSPQYREIIRDSGYAIARGRKGEPFVPGMEKVVILPQQDVSFRVLKDECPATANEEMLRLILDWLKYHGGTLAIYSHGFDEYGLSEWITFFEVLAKETAVQVVNLAQIAGEIRQGYHAGELGEYHCPEAKKRDLGRISYIPQDDSPLLGNGRATPHNRNFFGREVSAEMPKNIGIY